MLFLNKFPEARLTIWLKIWMAIARAGMWLYVHLYLYTAWSWLHERLYDRKYDNVEITLYPKLNDLAAWLRNFKWHADGWTEFWDAVCSAKKVQAVGQKILEPSDPHGNDCDEAARYGSTAINLSLAAGLMAQDNIERAYFMFVVWLKPSGASEGHAVTLIQYKNKKYAYMDYGDPSGQFDTITDVAELIRSNYVAKDTQYISLLWATFETSNLQPLDLQFK